MVVGYDDLFKFSIGKIFEVSITAKDHIEKYGTSVSREGENVKFNKCGISRMIIFAATMDGEESSQWILSLEDFLLFFVNSKFQAHAREERKFILNLRYLVLG